MFENFLFALVLTQFRLSISYKCFRSTKDNIAAELCGVCAGKSAPKAHVAV